MPNTTQHTPGPWSVSMPRDSRELSMTITTMPKTPGYGAVAHVAIQPASGITRKQSEANARLIAAAPELLEELKDAMNMLERLAVDTGNLNPEAASMFRKRAAIAKAEGKAV